ncbi:hypothetical protein LTR70_000961 [Exophiala xenobiotica]|uniref:Uncharacterized protein n=1 Tax=Lithohypha guttulata TaxID=1690604 RepID=A0ABR0JWT8_9EURO|nr:hypothetical protein LTR24_009479 [Lithohypha guttulata]KAK5329125.1 hypothetical protein LTR70_000961 [Exophiala xenobiotica]
MTKLAPLYLDPLCSNRSRIILEADPAVSFLRDVDDDGSATPPVPDPSLPLPVPPNHELQLSGIWVVGIIVGPEEDTSVLSPMEAWVKPFEVRKGKREYAMKRKRKKGKKDADDDDYQPRTLRKRK